MAGSRRRLVQSIVLENSCKAKEFHLLDGFLLREKVGPPLQQLVANTGLTTHMAVIEENVIR